MATAEQIAELRRLVDEPTETVYSDVDLSARIDAVSGDLNLLAGTVWREKAAKLTSLIDVQEGSSNRKMSQLQTQALKMASMFDVSLEATLRAPRAARTRKVERQ